MPRAYDSGQLIRGAPDEVCVTREARGSRGARRARCALRAARWHSAPPHPRPSSLPPPLPSIPFTDVTPYRQKKKKEGAKGKVESLFERAKELGAEAGSGDVPSTSGGAGGSGAPQAYVIRFYANGFFTINDGPGRRVDDPANHEFMEAVARCARLDAPCLRV